MDLAGPPVQVVEVDALPAYNDRCKTYRRMLVHVHVDEGRDYVVDVFDVVGGRAGRDVPASGGVRAVRG